MKENPLTKEQRFTLWSRSEGRCWWCGLPLDLERAAAHHRLLRSQGGRWNLDNIILLHHFCHNDSPGRPADMKLKPVHLEVKSAVGRGFIVRSEFSPTIIPIRDCFGDWWRLDDRGDKTPVPLAEALAAIP